MKRHTVRPDHCLSIPTMKFPAGPTCLLVAAMLLFLTSAPASVFAEGASCGELLKDRCQKCHYLTRVCQKLEKNQNSGLFGGVFAGSWSRTIHNMIRQGAKLTKAEQEKLTQCLDSASPEVLEVCGLKK